MCNLETLKEQFLTGVKYTQVLLDQTVEIKTVNNDLLDKIENTIKDICENEPKNVFKCIHLVQTDDDVIYTHCFNVATISYMIAKWCDLDVVAKEKLLIGALLHDIGKILVDDKVLNKEEKLSNTERAQVSSHTVEGYKNFRNSSLDKDTLSIILMHHERADGSGYPLGLCGAKINQYAKVVAIADVYDGMTAKRKYRSPHMPTNALRFIKDNKEKFDKEIVENFIENMDKIMCSEICEWVQ